MSLATRTVTLEQYALKTPYPSRREAIETARDNVLRDGHTIVLRSTYDAGFVPRRNRGWHGRFEKGWMVVTTVVPKGQALGLKDWLYVEDPKTWHLTFYVHDRPW